MLSTCRVHIVQLQADEQIAGMGGETGYSMVMIWHTEKSICMPLYMYANRSAINGVNLQYEWWRPCAQTNQVVCGNFAHGSMSNKRD